jgi:hypothetical protein
VRLTGKWNRWAPAAHRPLTDGMREALPNCIYLETNTLHPRHGRGAARGALSPRYSGILAECEKGPYLAHFRRIRAGQYPQIADFA